MFAKNGGSTYVDVSYEVRNEMAPTYLVPLIEIFGSHTWHLCSKEELVGITCYSSFVVSSFVVSPPTSHIQPVGTVRCYGKNDISFTTYVARKEIAYTKCG